MSRLYYIYASDGGRMLVGDMGFYTVTAMDTDPESGVIYAVGARPVDSVRVLLTIDPTTAAGTEIGPTTEAANSFTLEYACNGQLYSVLGFGGVASLYKISPTTGQAFDPVLLNFPPGFVNSPFCLDVHRSSLLPDPHLLFRDNTTSNRLRILRTELSPPLIELVGSTDGNLEAIAWAPGEETVIATGEPNDGGQFVGSFPTLRRMPDGSRSQRSTPTVPGVSTTRTNTSSSSIRSIRRVPSDPRFFCPTPLPIRAPERR